MVPLWKKKFNPLSLFAAGEQGILVPYLNITWLYQDYLFTTPVTAVEQPVGGILDQSGRGNNLIQSTPSKRPIYSARYNLLLDTEILATQNVTTVAANYILKFSGAGTVTLSGTATGVKSAGSSTITCTAGTLTLTVSGSVTQADIRPANDGVGLPAYQRVTTATDYDTAGFPPYLKFDGVDDALQTGTVDFTATNQMTVFAGVRKFSDSGQGVIVELSATIASNNGTFLLTGPNSAATNYNFSSKGTTQVDNIAIAYTSPISCVITGQSAIATPSDVIRANGSQVGSSSSSQGTGNYGNYALNIGARDASSLYFNGRIYSIIVRGAATSTAQIAQTETWINQKAKIYEPAPLDWRYVGTAYMNGYQAVRGARYISTTDTLTTPTGTYPGSSSFLGCNLLTDGRVFCVPYSSTSARIYDPSTDTLSTPTGTYPGSASFAGGTLLRDGRVFCVPNTSTSARIYDPSTDTLSTPTGTYPGGNAFTGGALLPDGRVFCVPNSSTSARIYDPVTDTLTTPTGTYPGSNAFVSGSLLYDGRVFCVPYSSTSARIYDPSTDTLSTPTGTYPGSASFAGDVLLSDGRVFCVPMGSTTARIYDPVTDTLSTPAGTYPGGVNLQYGVLLPDNRVFCAPRSSTTARIYDPATNTLTTPSVTYPGTATGFLGAILLFDGRVFSVPHLSTSSRLYDGGYNVTLPSARVLSTYDNKL